MTAVQGPDSRQAWSARLDQVERARAALALDAVVVSAPVNVRYLTGFDGSSGLLVLSRGARFLLVDGRYDASARAAVEQGDLAIMSVERVPETYAGGLARLIGRLRARRVGFESATVTVATLSAWQRRDPSVEWVGTERLVENLRLVKDEQEREIFRRAGRLLSDVAGQLPALVRAGLTERDVARSIDRALETAGFSGPAFPTIVASGPESAHPHARPSERRLAPGALVVLDFGGVLDGYCVDLTRMAAVGAIAPEAARLFEAVRDAQAAALGAVRPGAAGATVDQAARQVLAERGLSEAFLHATGHGLGLEVHEAPRLGQAGGSESPEVLAEGMVCTIEPGAYVAGLGGARLEDDVLVTSGGFEALTTAPRDLLVV
jgi:Xaa-Pro aminopeptidase